MKQPMLPMLQRAWSFDRASVDQEARTVRIALSSEHPVEQQDWWGERWFEILDHSPSAVDMTRLRNGQAPLLSDHNPLRQVGILENPSLDADGVLRVDARFSRSPEGEKEWQDVCDGIRTSVSVGYWIREMRLESEKDGVKTYRATLWEPAEGSLVSIPADPTVGAGRSSTPQAYPVRIVRAEGEATPPPPATAAGSPEVRMDNGNVNPGGSQAAPPAPPANVEEIRSQAVKDATTAERTRVAEIGALCDQFQVVPEMRAEFIGQGASLDQVRTALLEGFRAKASSLPAPTSERFGLDDKDRQRYSLARAVRALVLGDYSEAGFEREVSQTIGKQLGRATGGIFIPSDFRMKGRAANTMNTAGVGQGKELVFSEYQGYIDMLKNEAKALALGARVISGLQGNPTWVKQTAGSVFYWLGENPGVDVTDSKLGTSVVTATPKTAKAMLTYTRQQMLQSAESIESLIQQDLLENDALAVDSAALVGTGSSNQPTGILNTAGIGAVPLGTNGAVPTNKSMTALRTAVMKANALRLGAGAFLTTPDIQDLLENTARLSNSIAVPVWEDGKVAGYRAESTLQMPGNLTKGTASGICHSILFGIWPECFVLEWGALEMTVDPYTKMGEDLVRISTSHLLDIFVRRPAAFAAIKDALLA